jgi:hypothetical protein
MGRKSKPMSSGILSVFPHWIETLKYIEKV